MLIGDKNYKQDDYDTGHNDDLSVSVETGPPGPDEWGEPLPQSHRRHLVGETSQPTLGMSPPPQPVRPHIYLWR